MREFFRACELEPEMLEQAALTAAFLSAKERCVCALFHAHRVKCTPCGGPVDENYPIVGCPFAQSNRMLIAFLFYSL